MYRIIRASSDWGVVVVVTEQGLGQGQNKKYLLYSRLEAPNSNYFKMDMAELEKLADRGQVEVVFAEIPEKAAIGYFSGIANGLGFGEISQEQFGSLSEVWAHIRKKHREFVIEFCLKYGLELKVRNRYALFDGLMNANPLTAREFKEKLTERGLADRWPEFEARYRDKFRIEQPA